MLGLLLFLLLGLRLEDDAILLLETLRSLSDGGILLRELLRSLLLIRIHAATRLLFLHEIPFSVLIEGTDEIPENFLRRAHPDGAEEDETDEEEQDTDDDGERRIPERDRKDADGESGGEERRGPHDEGQDEAILHCVLELKAITSEHREQELQDRDRRPREEDEEDEERPRAARRARCLQKADMPHRAVQHAAHKDREADRHDEEGLPQLFDAAEEAPDGANILSPHIAAQTMEETGESEDHRDDARGQNGDIHLHIMGKEDRISFRHRIHDAGIPDADMPDEIIPIIRENITLREQGPNEDAEKEGQSEDGDVQDIHQEHPAQIIREDARGVLDGMLLNVTGIRALILLDGKFHQ